MKTRAFLVAVTGFMAVAVSAQEFKCEDNFKALGASVQSQDYATATTILAGLRKSCPRYDVAQYTLGETVLRYDMETAGTEADEKLYTTDLLAFYDEWERNFPGKGGVQKKALLLKEKSLVKDDEVFKILDGAFATSKTSFTSYEALELYYNLYLERYKAGDKGITQDDFIQKFGDMAGQANYAKSQLEQYRQQLLAKKETQPLEEKELEFLKYAPQNISAFEAVSDNMIIQSANLVDCNKLDAYYTGLYEKNKADKNWLLGMVTVLSGAKCTKSEVLYKGAEELYQAQPSLTTAMLLGDLSLRKDTKQAAVYFEKALAFEADSTGKSKIYLILANTVRNSDKAATKSYLLKAAAYNPKDGSPYIQLAEMYASAQGCQLSGFEKKAVNWLAIDTAKKAGAIEAKYKTTVANLLKRYEKNAPNKDDLKAAKKGKGDTVTFGCWINETVTVPKIK
jgi:hypothetical protein